MMNPEDLSLSEAAAAVRRCRLSLVEYVEALFRVMDRIESRIDAWVTVDRQGVLSEGAPARRKREMDIFADHCMVYPLESRTSSTPTDCGPRWVQSYSKTL